MVQEISVTSNPIVLPITIAKKNWNETTRYLPLICKTLSSYNDNYCNNTHKQMNKVDK